MVQEQQSAMDQALHEHKKQFQQGALNALIEARTKELSNKKQETNEYCLQFQQFLTETISDLQKNEIFLLLGSKDVEQIARKCISLFKNQDKRTNNLYKSLYFFQKKNADAQKQKRKEIQKGEKLNQELADPQIRFLQTQIAILEKQLKLWFTRPPNALE